MLVAPGDWDSVALVSDVHLHPEDSKTASLFLSWLALEAPNAANALFILGDLFEVWIGDDMVDSPQGEFQKSCLAAIHRCADVIPVYFMHGNRDFLLGNRAAALANCTVLPDPTVLQLGDQTIVLSHGDALCTADKDYQAFRQVVRSPQWQSDFLAKSLNDRISIARGLRDASQAKQAEHYATSADWIDLDTDAVEDLLARHSAQTLIHGHTHHAADHAMPGGGQRVVLSDWDANAVPRRAEVLIVGRDGRRVRKAAELKGHAA